MRDLVQTGGAHIGIMRHIEHHVLNKVGWLRAAVLGANDGIISTASLLLGVASASVAYNNILLAGIAGMSAGAMSMATGEYVSVSSQSDTEKAALQEERAELHAAPESELQELTDIYIGRGLEPKLAKQVSKKLMEHDALQAHARDELGLLETHLARPLQAATSSALSFTAGAALPLAVALLVPQSVLIPSIVVSALVSLGLLGGIAAITGAAPIGPSIFRVTFWSALSMGTSSGIGVLIGATAG